MADIGSMRHPLGAASAEHRPRLDGRLQLKLAPAFLGVLTALLISACGAAEPYVAERPFDRSLFGPFAGYVWAGKVHQVGGVVVVPHIPSSSPPGIGATWIAATGSQPKILTPDFFQIGVNELRNRESLGEKLRNLEYVFWSSTAKGFHPQFLFGVAPGDRVRLSMTLTADRWKMVATDETTGRSRSVSVRAGRGNVTYTEASWIQEDVAISEAGTQAPYPRLNGLRISDLVVNSAAPRPRFLRKSWMSTARGTFGPTAIRGGAFSIASVHLTRADLRYEQIAYALNLPAVAFANDLERWTDRTKRGEIVSACRSFAAVLHRNTASFERYPWPADIRAPMRRLIAATEASRTAVLDLSTVPSAKITEAAEAYDRSVVQIQTAALQVKAILHIPINNYSGEYWWPTRGPTLTELQARDGRDSSRDLV